MDAESICQFTKVFQDILKLSKEESLTDGQSLKLASKKKGDIRQDCVLSIYTKRIVDISIELVYNKEAESKK